MENQSPAPATFSSPSAFSPPPSPSPSTGDKPDDFMTQAQAATSDLDQQLSIQHEAAQPKNRAMEVALIGGLILVVLVGMTIWLKPWNQLRLNRDKKNEAHAAALGADISQFYMKKDVFPWNYAVKDYVPLQRRPESAFVYLPKKAQERAGQDLVSRDWLTNYVSDESGLTDDEKDYWLKNDEMYVLKQVSSGNRVVICFVPQSEQYREQSTEDCTQDSLGRRDAPYEVAGFDPCATIDGTQPERKAEFQNLYCVVSTATTATTQ